MTSKRGRVVSNAVFIRSRSTPSMACAVRSMRYQSRSLARLSLAGRRSGFTTSLPPRPKWPAPVTDRAASLISQSTVPATSCGVTNRPLRVSECGPRLRFAAAGTLDDAVDGSLRGGSVSVKPGQTALTRTPRAAVSTARARIRPTTPCLAAI